MTTRHEWEQESNGHNPRKSSVHPNDLRAVCSRIIDAVIDGETRPSAIASMLDGIEADKARLDWLESKSKHVVSITGSHRGYHELPSISVDYWCGKTGATSGVGLTPATLRAAIDAAMNPAAPAPAEQRHE